MKVLRIFSGVVLVAFLFTSIFYGLVWRGVLAPAGEVNALRAELAQKRADIFSITQQYWELEDSVWETQKDTRFEIQRLEALKRQAEDREWLIQSKLDNLRRALQAIEKQFVAQIDDLQDSYEQEIIDLGLEIDGLEREKARLNEEGNLLRNQLRMSVMAYDPGGLKNFQDINELYTFLAAIDINKIVYDDESFQSGNYMFLLMRLAARQGYAIYPAAFYSVEGNRIIEAHGANMAIIEQAVIAGQEADFYVAYVEPQTLEVLYVGRLPIPDNWREVLVPFFP